LFIIIALGESIVVTGATTSEIGLTGQTAVAFGTAFFADAAALMVAVVVLVVLIATIGVDQATAAGRPQIER
jgi:hypothetical protein